MVHKNYISTLLAGVLLSCSTYPYGIVFQPEYLVDGYGTDIAVVYEAEGPTPGRLIVQLEWDDERGDRWTQKGELLYQEDELTHEEEYYADRFYEYGPSGESSTYFFVSTCKKKRVRKQKKERTKSVQFSEFDTCSDGEHAQKNEYIDPIFTAPSGDHLFQEDNHDDEKIEVTI